MGTGARVAEEGAYFVGGLGGQNVFELAGLFFDFGFAIHGEAVGEKALGEAVATDDIGSALAAARCEFDNHAAVAG